MPSSLTKPSKPSIWQRLWAALKNESAPLAAGIVLGLATGGPVGFIAAYCAVCGYRSAQGNEESKFSKEESKFSKMVGLGVASAAATIGFGLALPPVGLVIGTTLIAAAASYLNDGFVKVAVSGMVGVIKRGLGLGKAAEAAGHEHSPAIPPQKPSKDASAIIKPSLAARARAAAKRARDTIFRIRAQRTIDAALEARRNTDKETQKK